MRFRIYAAAAAAASALMIAAGVNAADSFPLSNNFDNLDEGTVIFLDDHETPPFTDIEGVTLYIGFRAARNNERTNIAVETGGTDGSRCLVINSDRYVSVGRGGRVQINTPENRETYMASVRIKREEQQKVFYSDDPYSMAQYTGGGTELLTEAGVWNTLSVYVSGGQRVITLNGEVINVDGVLSLPVIWGTDDDTTGTDRKLYIDDLEIREPTGDEMDAVNEAAFEYAARDSVMSAIKTDMQLRQKSDTGFEAYSDFTLPLEANGAVITWTIEEADGSDCGRVWMDEKTGRVHFTDTENMSPFILTASCRSEEFVTDIRYTVTPVNYVKNDFESCDIKNYSSLADNAPCAELDGVTTYVGFREYTPADIGARVAVAQSDDGGKCLCLVSGIYTSRGGGRGPRAALNKPLTSDGECAASLRIRKSAEQTVFYSEDLHKESDKVIPINDTEWHTVTVYTLDSRRYMLLDGEMIEQLDGAYDLPVLHSDFDVNQGFVWIDDLEIRSVSSEDISYLGEKLADSGFTDEVLGCKIMRDANLARAGEDEINAYADFALPGDFYGSAVTWTALEEDGTVSGRVLIDSGVAKITDRRNMAPFIIKAEIASDGAPRTAEYTVHPIDSVKVGDYVLMGAYYGEPILWRCAAVDENGPLMISDEIICLKPFDARTGANSESGSHSRPGTKSPDIRAEQGSNYWADSNMRSWLNSDAEAGNVEWLCKNPPDPAHTSYNAYDGEAGFLTSFGDIERFAIKSTERVSVLPTEEIKAGMYSEGSENIDYFDSCPDKLLNYDRAYAERVTDKIFVPDIKQINAIYKNGDILGCDYYVGRLSAAAVENCDDWTGSNPPPEMSVGGNFAYWLSTPVYNTHIFIFQADSDGTIRNGSAAYGYVGVRPAFYMNESAYFASGSGAADAPYTIGAEPAEINVASDFSADKAVFTLTSPGSGKLLAQAKLFLAEYDDNGAMISVKRGVKSEIRGGSLTITADLPQSGNYKYMLWDGLNRSLMDAIDDIRR